MRNFLVVLTLSIITSSSAYAGWWRTYGGEEEDDGYTIEQTPDSGYIISTYSGYPGRYRLMKLDNKGDSLWGSDYGGGFHWGRNCVRTTFDGGYIASGSGIFKIDEDGNLQWKNNQNWPAFWVEQTSDSGYIAVGIKETIYSEHPYISGSEIYLLKTTSEGVTEWLRAFGDGGPDIYSGAYCVKETADKGYIIAGFNHENHLWLIKTDLEGKSVWERHDYSFFTAGFVIQNTAGQYVITGGGLLMIVDSLGEIIWNKPYGGNSIQQTQDGGYFIVGSKSLGEPQWYDLWLIKTDSLGDTLWTRLFGGEHSDYGCHGQQTCDGGYIVIGSTESFDAGSSDIYLLKTDSIGLLGVSEPPPVTPITPVTHLEMLSPIGPSIIMRYSNCQGGFRAFVYDAGGRRVDEIESPGESGILAWGACYGPGVYFIRVESETSPFTVKVVLVR